MSVHVQMMRLLAKRARSHRERFQVAYQTGCTPASILDGEGFTDLDCLGIAALVNGEQAELDQPLADGDRLEFLIAIQGGAYVRPSLWPPMYSAISSS